MLVLIGNGTAAASLKLKLSVQLLYRWTKIAEMDIGRLSWLTNILLLLVHVRFLPAHKIVETASCLSLLALS